MTRIGHVSIFWIFPIAVASSVKRIDAGCVDATAAFNASWTPELESYNARDAPKSAAKAVAASLAFVTRALPADVVAELSELAVDPQAPAAILLSGLHVPDAPPTPLVSTVHGKLGDAVRVPMAEAWALGLARLIGYPFVPPYFDKGHRGGLARDMVPVPGVANLVGMLEMHRDFPRSVFAPFPEPEMLILVCVRGDENATTLVVDNAKVVADLDDQTKHLLREHKMQVEIVQKNGTVHAQGAAFHAIEGDALTIFVPDAASFGEDAVGRVVSPTGGAAAEAAWRTLLDTALRLADEITLRRGEALIINNVRACHGRTGFEPKLDGADRWLVKTYLTSNLWSRVPYPTFKVSFSENQTS